MEKAEELLQKIETGAYDETFCALYCTDAAGAQKQRARYGALKKGPAQGKVHYPA